MNKYKIGDLVYVPGSRTSKFNEENDNLFVITRYLDEKQIIIGFIDFEKYEITSEYIVNIKQIRRYRGLSFQDAVSKLVKHHYLNVVGDAIELNHTNDSEKGYLPILGINKIIAHKK